MNPHPPVGPVPSPGGAPSPGAPSPGAPLRASAPPREIIPSGTDTNVLGTIGWDLGRFWLPASTPPPDDRTVLISHEDRNEAPQIWFGYYSHKHATWLGAEGTAYNVTHWMPIPRPPSGGPCGEHP